MTDLTVRTIRYSDFAEQGHWPILGGTLDQSASFLAACEFIWRESKAYK